MITVLFIGLAVLLFIGVPIAVCIGGAPLLAMAVAGNSRQMFIAAQRMITAPAGRQPGAGRREDQIPGRLQTAQHALWEVDPQ